MWATSDKLSVSSTVFMGEGLSNCSARLIWTISNDLILWKWEPCIFDLKLLISLEFHHFWRDLPSRIYLINQDHHNTWCDELIISETTAEIHCGRTLQNKKFWARWRLKSPASRLFTQPFIQAKIKENIKAPRHWPLCGEFTGDRRIPRTNSQ